MATSNTPAYTHITLASALLVLCGVLPQSVSAAQTEVYGKLETSIRYLHVNGSDSGNNGDTTTPPQTGGSNNNGGQTSGAPQTGDQSNLVLWAVLLLAAVAGFVALALYGRKRNRG